MVFNKFAFSDFNSSNFGSYNKAIIHFYLHVQSTTPFLSYTLISSSILSFFLRLFLFVRLSLI